MNKVLKFSNENCNLFMLSSIDVVRTKTAATYEHASSTFRNVLSAASPVYRRSSGSRNITHP